MEIIDIKKQETITIVCYKDDNGFVTNVGIPFVTENKQEILNYISENYIPFDPNNPGEIESSYLQVQYRDQRQMEYPSIGDQLDALWKGGEAAEEMLAKVQAVKAKYPKPE